MDRQADHTQETISNDGTSLTVDANTDGNPELTALDMNKDGKADVVITDVDSDGAPEAVIIDLDGDGKADIALVDSDGDGVIDSLTTGSSDEQAEDADDLAEEESQAVESVPIPIIIDVDEDMDDSAPEGNDQDEETAPLGPDVATGWQAPIDDSLPADEVQGSSEEAIVTDDKEQNGQATSDDSETGNEGQNPESAEDTAAAEGNLSDDGATAADNAEQQAAETEKAPVEDFSHKVADVRYEDHGSGHVDTATIDRDGDGWFEESKSVSLEDRDSDGARDTAFADLNNDGWQEKVGQDTDRDGVMNAMDDGSGFISRDAILHDGESRTADENLKEVSGENDADTHDGWNARTETIDDDHSMKYDSQGHVTIVDAEGDETQVANIDDVTHRVGTEGDAATENVGIDHDGYAANVFVDGAGGHSGYDADGSGGYDAHGSAGYDAPAEADTASADSGSSNETASSYDSSYDSGEA
jgi:hypothetical protein